MENLGDLLQEDPDREEQEVRRGSELRLSQTGWLDEKFANVQCILIHFNPKYRYRYRYRGKKIGVKNFPG